MWRASATVLTEVSGERQRGVWARQSGGGGGQDEAFPVACSTATNKNRNGDITRVTNVIHPNAKIMHKEKKNCDENSTFPCVGRNAEMQCRRSSNPETCFCIFKYCIQRLSWPSLQTFVCLQMKRSEKLGASFQLQSNMRSHLAKSTRKRNAI